MFTIVRCEIIKFLGESCGTLERLFLHHILLVFVGFSMTCLGCVRSLGFRECDRLDGASNFVPCKLILHIVLGEVGLWEHVVKENLEPIDFAQLATHQKEETKVKIIILSFVKNHFISHISNNMIGKKMFECLFSSYFKILVLLDRSSYKSIFRSFIRAWKILWQAT